MKKIIYRILFLTLLLSGLTYSTIAFFNDSEKSDANTFAAGTINLKIGNHSFYNGALQTLNSWELKDLTIEKFFSLSDLKPGDWGENTIDLTVGSNNAYACMNLDITLNEDNTIVNSEDKMDGNIDDFDGTLKGDLSQEVNFILWSDDGDNVFEDDEEIIIEDSLSNSLDGITYTLADSQQNFLDSNPSLDPAKTYSIGQAWCYGELSLSPLVQDGFSDQISSEGNIENSGIACNGTLVSNLSQTDSLLANLSFYAVQSDNNGQFICSDNLFPPVTTTYAMENKKVNSDWTTIEGDSTYGELEYIPVGPTFDFSFSAMGLNAGENYCLIYYADPWPGDNPGVFIGSSSSDNNGNLSFSGSPDIGMSLPHPDDDNYPTGAKVWLIPCDNYNQSNNKVDPWSPNENDWLFDNDTAGIVVNYTRTTPPSPTPIPTLIPTPSPSSSLTSINIDEYGSEINDQYAYNHDYSQAQVNLTYQNPVDGDFVGTITGSGLKPFASYQTKFTGVPTCIDSTNGNDTANEYLGYKGRWTCTDCTGSAVSRNRSDAQYEANKLLPDSDPNKECIAGYLVFDYFSADQNGLASKVISTNNSYHVLFCGGGTCNTVNNNYLAKLDPAHPTVDFCPADKVNGQLERLTCGGLDLDSGNYSVLMSLTEESFHQGNWATVLQKPISFIIN